ncbi:MAG: PilW family protein [Myxococcota bacterium]|nr:PilW family protein [Myxococcota bacterium]
MRTVRRGFTLIEMMIAVVVSSIVVAGLYSIFNLQSRQFLYQDLQMEMHQNIRFATDVLSRSIRMAGYGTGGTVTGYHGSTTDDTTLPVIMSWDAQGDNDSDGITVVYADPSLRMNTAASIETCGTESFTIDLTNMDQDAKIAEYEAGELLVCSDYANLTGIESYLWVISSVSSSSGVITVENNSGYSDYEAVCGESENLAPSMLCSKAHVMTFYVDADDSDGVGPGSEDNPVLMMDLNLDWPNSDDVPLVDNIEDVQFEYCVNDGSTGPTCDSDHPENWDDDVSSGSETDVWMVRMHIVGRSSRKDPQLLRTSTRPELANHSAASSSDHYYRQVLTTEVAVRNLRLQDNL